MSERRVVITGLGVVTPLGNEVEPFWQALLAGRSGIRPLQRFDTGPFAVRIGGECVDFDPSRYVDTRTARRMDRFTQFAVAAAADAAADSGLDFDREDPTRIGVIIGSGIGGLHELEEQHLRLIHKGPDKVSAFTIPKLMVNAASGAISIRLGVQGPNTAVATACASAGNAMGDAFHSILRGEADAMITGGSEAAVTPLGLSAFTSMRALSTRNDDPPAASRPFDADRDGFVMAEGAGVLVFEEFEHARRRNAGIYAEVIGTGVSGDAVHMAQPDEHGRGAIQAMQMCLRDAGINPDDVHYVNAHGTGTPLGDLAETKALKAVFGAYAPKLPVSSTKSSIGHLLGASGGVELIISLMALRDQVLPPTINRQTPDPQCDLDYVPLTPREARVTTALSNSFGFGGHNACILVRKL